MAGSFPWLTRLVMDEMRAERSGGAWPGLGRSPDLCPGPDTDKADFRRSVADVPASSCFKRLEREAAPCCRPWLGLR